MDLEALSQYLTQNLFTVCSSKMASANECQGKLKSVQRGCCLMENVLLKTLSTLNISVFRLLNTEFLYSFCNKVENCSSNSVAFEVVFSPGVENARKPQLTPRKGKESLSKQQLEEKMKAAEKRRTVGNSSMLDQRAPTFKTTSQA